jgi:hypothetical protein
VRHSDDGQVIVEYQPRPHRRRRRELGGGTAMRARRRSGALCLRLS